MPESLIAVAQNSDHHKQHLRLNIYNMMMQWPLSFTFNDLGIFSQILVVRLIHGYNIHKQFFVSLDCKVKPKEISTVS